MTTSGTYPQGAPAQDESSAIKAGWICYGIGVVTAPFVIGIYLFPVAIICAIVALCTHDVRRGIILLVTTMVTGPILALVFVAGILGTTGILVSSAMEKANRAKSGSVYSTPSSQILRAIPKPPKIPMTSTSRRTARTETTRIKSQSSRAIQIGRTTTINLAGLSPEERVFAQINLQGIAERNGEYRAAVNGTGFYLRETRVLNLGKDQRTLTCTAIDDHSVTLRIVRTQFSRRFEL